MPTPASFPTHPLPEAVNSLLAGPEVGEIDHVRAGAATVVVVGRVVVVVAGAVVVTVVAIVVGTTSAVVVVVVSSTVVVVPADPAVTCSPLSSSRVTTKATAPSSTST